MSGQKVSPDTYRRTLGETLRHAQETRCAMPPMTDADFIRFLDAGYDEAPAFARTWGAL